MQFLKRIGSGWTTLQFIRVFLGLLILCSSLTEGHVGGIFLGSLFTLIALLTDGVCGAACYNPPVKKRETKNINEIAYEELDTRP